VFLAAGTGGVVIDDATVVNTPLHEASSEPTGLAKGTRIGKYYC
jgi:hypothetical protein